MADSSHAHNLFEHSFHHAAIGMALSALDGRWLKVNRALTKIVGYSEEELLNSNFQALTHPEDLGADLANALALITGHITTYRREKRYIHKNGSVIWIQLDVSLVRRADGRPDFFIAQIQDITARKRAEAERDTFFNFATDMLAIVGSDGYFKQVNPVWTEVLGWSAAELAEGPGIRFVHPEDREATIAEAQRVAAGNASPNFTNRYLTRDGSYRWIEWKASPMHGNKLFCVARDVSERKKAEADLARAREDMQAVADTMPAMIAYWGLDMRNRFVNRRYADLFGLTPEQIRGRHVREVVGDALFASLAPRIAAVLQGSEQAFESLLTDARGRSHCYDVAYVPHRKDGEVLGYCVMATESARRRGAKDLPLVAGASAGVAGKGTEAPARVV